MRHAEQGGVFLQVQLKQIGHPEVIGDCIVVSQQRATLGHQEVIMILVSQVISVHWKNTERKKECNFCQMYTRPGV